MPRIKKPKYLTYKNELPVRMPEIGEVVSVYWDNGDLYIKGTVKEFEYEDEEIQGFELISSNNVTWWWHINTFGWGGSNHDKFLKIRRYYET